MIKVMICEKTLKKTSGCLLLLLLLLTCSCQKKSQTKNESIVEDIKQKGVITVVTNAVFPPFEYFKYNQIEGIDIDISKEIAKDMGVELEVLEMGFDGIVAAIASGKGDFVASGLTKDSQKEKVVSFSKSYITVPQSLVVMKNDPANDIQSLLNKRIGVQIGTTSSKYIKSELEQGFLKNSESKIVEKKEYLDLITDLRNKRLDIIAMDGLIARQLVKKNNDLRYFDRDGEDYVLAVKKGNEELLNYINQTIERLISENKIQDFYHNHYGKYE